MAITRIYETGFEWNNLPLEVSSVNQNLVGRVAITNTVARTGTYSVRRYDTYSGNYIIQFLDAALTQCRISFHFRHEPFDRQSNEPIIVALGLSSVAISPVMTLRWDGVELMVSAGYDDEAPVDYH